MKIIRILTIAVLIAGCGGAPSAASVELRNKEIIMACNELRNAGDLDGAAACFADELTHQGKSVTRQQLRAVLGDIYTAFPDYHTEIHELVAEGDIVVERSTVSGTHNGVATMRHNGGTFAGVDPTSRHFEIQHIHWWKLKTGKVVEHYAARDDLGLARQLGLLPPLTSPQ